MSKNVLFTQAMVLGILALTSFAQAASAAAPAFDRKDYFGEAVLNNNGKLNYVVENAKQTHSKEQFVFVEVNNFKITDKNRGGRMRVVVWDKAENFAQPDKAPFRAVSFPVKDAVDGKMKFKIGGLTPKGSYAFFAHFDENDDGILNRNFLGVPTEPYMFTNKDNQGKGPGLKRVGLSAPKFESTLVNYTGPGQVITISF